jgi:acetyl-CoA/propionyl-CoA carboxylase biotin carboxyl carrier protein
VSTSPALFDTVLVANRGEIAVRIISTLRMLGIRSVAVYSDADRRARHVSAADVALRIGPAAASQSYLDIDAVVQAAVASGAQALHPGYGFLAENPELARACAEAGITFVGPPVSAIEAMGDKIRAKQTVAANGVQVVPGVGAPGMTDEQLVEAAGDLGFPILIKPSAGGGGKGMRLVEGPAGLPGELAAARREALGAFGDDSLLLERFVGRPRHIEVQVLADSHGQVVHLGERECSLQRRHQKVIEEAPSPWLHEEHRQALGEQAVAASRACGYVNAGTVEFIVSGDRPDEAYFMEMNTRLQVEHPVTELTWGVDLVELQLRVAAGERLPFTQADLRRRGHAFEARVYAEDPARGFLPTGGRVLALDEPSELADVRVDSSLVIGADIGSTYDPMLSKIIAWGPDRDAARRSLEAALASTTILGVTTNLAFLRTVLADPDVVAGRLDTELVERIAERYDGPGGGPPRAAVVAAAARVILGEDPEGRRSTAGLDPWDDRGGWRIGTRAWSTWRATDADGTAHTVRLRRRVDAAVHDGVGDHPGFEVLGDDGEVVDASFHVAPGEIRVDLAGETTRWSVARSGRTTWVGRQSRTYAFSEPDPALVAAAAGAGTGTVTSPMPGTVVTVTVERGEHVLAGQALVVVEAMKMEHTVRAPGDGQVADVLVAVGDQVALNQLLAVVKPATDA